MSVEVWLSNAELRAKRPVRDLENARKAYEKAKIKTDQAIRIASEMGIPVFFVFSGELNVPRSPESSDKNLAVELAKKAGVFDEEIDLQRCFVGAYTLLEGFHETGKDL